MKKHIIAVLIVLVIEAITFFIARNQTANADEAFYTVVGVAVLVGILAVVMLSAEDSFGKVCHLAVGPIVTVVVTCLIILAITGINPGAGLGAFLAVGIVIVFSLGWIHLDYYLTKKNTLNTAK